MIVSFCQNLLGGNDCPLVYCVNLMILFSNRSERRGN